MSAGKPGAAAEAESAEAEAELGTALVARARAAALQAYAPYSKFRVGAAVRANGQVFVGCNVENASFGLTVCAERVALFSAVAAGCTAIEALAVCCLDAPRDAPLTSRTPCGACRQVMAELASPQTPVWIDGVGSRTVAELLPEAFVLQSR